MVAEKEKTTAASHQETTREREQLGELINERHEALRDQLERAEKQHENDNQVDEKQALQEASELAKEAEKEQSVHSSPAERRRGAPSRKLREATLKSQLAEIQGEMSTGGRIFSKVIHTKSIENTSDAAASTIARPNALLSGSIAAFIGVTICYFVAKYYGYQLSGFETIAAFIFGWVIGILYDYFSVMIRGHRKNR